MVCRRFVNIVTKYDSRISLVDSGYDGVHPLVRLRFASPVTGVVVPQDKLISEFFNHLRDNVVCSAIWRTNKGARDAQRLQKFGCCDHFRCDVAFRKQSQIAVREAMVTDGVAFSNCLRDNL